MQQGALNFGARFANIEGRIMPRSGRILLYFGATFLVAGFTNYFLFERTYSKYRLAT